MLGFSEKQGKLSGLVKEINQYPMPDFDVESLRWSSTRRRNHGRK